MSGLEIAGLVLGAIPVLIAAINSYQTTRQRLKVFKYKVPYLMQLVQSLKEQRYFIESDIIGTLRASSHLEDDEIYAVLRQPGLGLFKDPEIADAVGRYLGEGYSPYLSAVARCQQILQDIANAISGLVFDAQEANLAAIVQAHPVKSSGGYEFTKKIQFSLQKDDLVKRIKDLDDATSTLRKIRDTSTYEAAITVESTSRTIAKLASHLNTVRSYALHLYSAISKAYAAGCHHQHEARLLLQNQSALMKPKKGHTPGRIPVVFTLNFPHERCSSLRSMICCKANIKVLDEEMQVCAVGIRSTPVVRVSLPDASRARPPPPPKDLTDLCYHIRQVYDGKMPPSLFLSRRGDICYYDGPLRPVATRDLVVEKSDDIFSLRCTLQGKSNPDPSLPRWKLTQRMALSYTAASSVLQLISTPWLQLPLTSESLYFSQSSRNLGAVPELFIIERFSKPLPTTDSKQLCDPRRSLVELGILLLELWSERTVDSYVSEAGLILDDSFGSRYTIAKEWLNSSKDCMLPCYSDVVARCVECTFATSGPTPDGTDIVFRKSVCEYVLKPLWENCVMESRQ